jgi:hypothetical protein
MFGPVKFMRRADGSLLLDLSPDQCAMLAEVAGHFACDFAKLTEVDKDYQSRHGKGEPNLEIVGCAAEDWTDATFNASLRIGVR